MSVLVGPRNGGIDEFVAEALSAAAPPAAVEYQRSPLWDRSWILEAALALLSAEWALRRWNSLA